MNVASGIRGSQAGMSLIELTVGLTISVFIMGSIVAMQATASEAFEGSNREQKMTRALRSGVKVLREQLRSARPDSIVAINGGASGEARLSFQEAIDFNLAAGTSVWGAGGVEDAVVEYYVDKKELWRRVRLPSDQIQPGSEERILTGLVWTSNFNPLVLDWEPDSASLDLQVFIENEDRDTSTVRARRVHTKVHVEPVFEF
jgi:hypothetical protein